MLQQTPPSPSIPNVPLLSARMWTIILVVNIVLVIVGVGWPTYTGYLAGTTAFVVGAFLWFQQNTSLARRVFANNRAFDVAGALGCFALIGCAAISASVVDDTSLAAVMCLFLPFTLADLGLNIFLIVKLRKAALEEEAGYSLLPVSQPATPASASVAAAPLPEVQSPPATQYQQQQTAVYATAAVPPPAPLYPQHPNA